MGQPSARFARHQLIEGFDQHLVSSLRIAVIGAGAVGNEFIKNCLLIGVGTIDVFDYDTVELSNLTRSVFLRESDIGLNKAYAVVARAAELYPACQLTAVPGSIFDTLTLSKAKQYDVIVAAVDNLDARLRINEIALINGQDWINCAIDARSAVVETFPFKTLGHKPACYACQLPASVFERRAKRYSCGGLQRAAYIDNKIPTTTITASIAAAQGLSELLRLVHARAGAETGQFAAQPFALDQSSRRYLDTLSFVATRSAMAHQQECASCGFTLRSPVIKHPIDKDSLLAILSLLCKDGASIQLSDAVIADAVCQLNPLHKSIALHGERAARVSDAATWCELCQDHSVAISVDSSVNAGEFERLLPALKPSAIAWISIDEIIVEFPS